jgi:hypothetical protein
VQLCKNISGWQQKVPETVENDHPFSTKQPAIACTKKWPVFPPAKSKQW